MNTTNLSPSHPYINLTTFRKNGQEVPTPVWFAEIDGRLYVFTGAQTGKAKRIRANGRARVAPSDARGKPLGNFIPMRARFVQDEDLLRRADALYKRKYGFQRTLINWLNRLRGRQDTPVLIELTSEQA
jgi:PPOX class probable F420-dependent enzyme